MAVTPFKKILLVDDNLFMLEVMGKAFTNEGFECLKAETVNQALGVLKDSVPDIILSDYERQILTGLNFENF